MTGKEIIALGWDKVDSITCIDLSGTNGISQKTRCRRSLSEDRTLSFLFIGDEPEFCEVEITCGDTVECEYAIEAEYAGSEYEELIEYET